MYRIPRRRPYPPVLDLTSMREALFEMRDSAARVPGLETLTAALTRAIEEAEAAEHASGPQQTYSPLVAKFLPLRS